jgi:hypothetical protein
MTISVNKAADSSGLLVAYDFNNPKSLIGPQLTNLASYIVPVGGTGTGYVFTGWYDTNVYVPQLGTFPTVSYVDIQNNYPATSGQCCWEPFAFGGFTVSPSTVYTYSIVYKCDSGYSHPNFMYRYEYNGATYVMESGTLNTANRIHLGGGWYWAWSTFTTQPTTDRVTNAGSFYYQYSTGTDRLYVAKVLFCQGNYTTLHPRYWPDVASTRSATQAFKDLTGNTSATAVSVTYAADGKPIIGAAGGSSSINLGKTSYTLGIRRVATYTGWVKGADLSTVGAYVISDYDQVGTPYGMTLRINNSTSADFYVFPNNHRITYTSTFVSNTWYHLTGVMDGPTMYLYVNGVLAGTQTLGEDIGPGTQSLHIGARGDTEVGASSITTTSIGSVKVFARALQAAEILSMFTAERGVYGV